MADSLDETLKLLAEAQALAERMKARAADQHRDQRELDRVLAKLQAPHAHGFEHYLPGIGGQGPGGVPSMTHRTTVLSAVANAAFAAAGPQGTHGPHGWVMEAAGRKAFETLTRFNARVQASSPAEEPPSKYETILGLIASGRFDIGMAARAIYGGDDERSRNRVRAGVNHLKDRGLITRHPNGTLEVVRRRPIPDAEASAENRERVGTID